MSDAFYKSSFFLNYLTLMYDGDQLKLLLVHCFVHASYQYCLCVATKTFRVFRGSWRLKISVFSCDSSIPSNMWITCASQAYGK